MKLVHPEVAPTVCANEGKLSVAQGISPTEDFNPGGLWCISTLASVSVIEMFNAMCKPSLSGTSPSPRAWSHELRMLSKLTNIHVTLQWGRRLAQLSAWHRLEAPWLAIISNLWSAHTKRYQHNSEMMHQNIGATFELNGDNGYCKGSYKFLPSKPFCCGQRWKCPDKCRFNVERNKQCTIAHRHWCVSECFFQNHSFLLCIQATVYTTFKAHNLKSIIWSQPVLRRSCSGLLLLQKLL